VATVRIEPPRKNWMVYYYDRDRVLQHKSLGIPHSPYGATAQERRERGAINKRIAIATANDIELAEHGPRTISYIKGLFNAAKQRAMGIFDQNGTRGMSIRGWFDSWLIRQSHLNEGRKIYQGYINSFCGYLGESELEALLYLDVRHAHGFIQAQLEAGLSATTINNKLCMLENALEDAVRKGFMLGNIITEDDYLDEDRMVRKPFNDTHLSALRERWLYLVKTDEKKGPFAKDWLTASKLGAYQGMRLGDSTNQISGNLDFGVDEKGFITWMPEKTAHLDRILILPMHSIVRAHLLPFEGTPPDTKLTPVLSAIRRPELSTMFKKELIATGIDPEEHKVHEQGRSFASYTFHSHKHFYVDRMEKALVPENIRKWLAAHTSDNAHKQYLHPWTRQEAEAWREYIEKVK
jgi:hypothetical protein